MNELEQKLQYMFQDKSLLENALRHSFIYTLSKKCRMMFHNYLIWDIENTTFCLEWVCSIMNISGAGFNPVPVFVSLSGELDAWRGKILLPKGAAILYPEDCGESMLRRAGFCTKFM